MGVRTGTFGPQAGIPRHQGPRAVSLTAGRDDGSSRLRTRIAGQFVRGRPRGWPRHGEHEVPQVLNRIVEFGYGMPEPTRHRTITIHAEREIQVKPGGEQAVNDRLTQHACIAVMSRAAAPSRLARCGRQLPTRRQVRVDSQVINHTDTGSFPHPLAIVARCRGPEQLHPPPHVPVGGVKTNGL